jgi:tetratricopeptide (TPR) repeat protein
MLMYGSFAFMVWLPSLALGETSKRLAQLYQAANQEIAAGNYDSAYKHAMNLRSEAVYENNQMQIANALSLIGKVFYHLSDFSSSLDFHNQALTLYQNLNDTTKIATALDDISHIHLQLEDYPTALEFSQKAIEQLEKITENQTVKAKILTNHGYVLFKNLELDKAKQQFDRAEEIINRNSLHRYYVYYLLMRSEIARTEKHIDESKGYLEQAIKNASQLSLPELVIAAKLELAKVHFENKHYQQAIELVESDIAQLQKQYRLDIQESIHKLLSDSYKALGNYQKALEHKEKEQHLHITYANILTRQHKNIIAIERKLEDNKERIADLERQHTRQIQELKHQQQINELMFIGVIVLLLIVLAVIYFKYKHLKK